MGIENDMVAAQTFGEILGCFEFSWWGGWRRGRQRDGALSEDHMGHLKKESRIDSRRKGDQNSLGFTEQSF